ncbi:IQ domain-containing protein E isoform X2 [Saccopteryx leptura]|uniref:IQ domain-containing protein E isoform X2 n=1 Tax=Saccopteryx leptura TaxID=249018 RepID=UPI00339C727D
MSLGTGDLASETGDDSLSVITFDSDSETKAKRNSSHKTPPTAPKSPYHSKPRKVTSWQSLRTTASVPLDSRMPSAPRKLWPGSSKQGSLTQPPKSALPLERACPHAPSSSPDYLAEALRMKRSNLRRSASNGHVPGTPVYREKEDMYEEIIGLKKALHVQKSDADLMRTKLRRLEEENTRKDRQIEQLLDPSRGSDFAWTLAEKRPETSWVINGLKQRILKLEQQCKDKDSTISKLQADVKTTDLEEMRIAMETYYEEIHRLQTLLASLETTGRKPPAEKKSGLRRQRKLSSTLLSLSRSVQELTEENRSLKEDLDRVLSCSPTLPRTRGYAEWSKPRLLRRIAELEKISSMEIPKPEASDVVKSDTLALYAPSSPVSGQPRSERQEDSEHPEDSTRLRGAVRSLKGERKALQAQLQQRDVEVEQLLRTRADLEKELQGVREGEEERRAREEALREEIQALTKKFQDLEAIKKEEEDDPMEVAPERGALTGTEVAGPLACGLSAPGHPESWRPHTQEDAEPDASEEASSRPPGACPEERRHMAARVLQARWKGYRRQKKKAALDEAACVLQAAFRGHLARTKLLLSRGSGSESPGEPCCPAQNAPAPCVPSPPVPAEGDPELEAAVTLIQSALRAHLARVRHSQTVSTTALAKSTSASATHGASAGQEDSEGGSGDTVEGPTPWARAPRPWGPGAPAALQPCPAAPPPSGQQPVASPRAEEVYSDDSDEIVMAPSLPAKRNGPPPPALGASQGVPRGDALSGEG